MAAFELHLRGISAAEATVIGGHHFSLRQCLAQSAAGFKRRVVGSLRADHALANEIHPCAVAVALPSTHPLAVAPAVGAEQRHALATEAALARIEHGLELHFLQHLAAHGGAAEGDGAAGVQIAGLYLGGREQHRLRARGSHALGSSLRHGLRISRTTPINNSSFHVCQFLSFNDFRQRRTIRQADSARNFSSGQGLKSEGILYVFRVFKPQNWRKRSAEAH